MIRAMWTAATGMTAQQINVDTIAHNLANVNTNSFKRSRAEFADLLYQVQRMLGTNASNVGVFPVGIQIGSSSRDGGQGMDAGKHAADQQRIGHGDRWRGVFPGLAAGWDGHVYPQRILQA